jgi:hypothetical protein
VIAAVQIGILTLMRFDLRQLPEPSPPPIKEPPEGPESPDVPVREPDSDEPFQMSRGLKSNRSIVEKIAKLQPGVASISGP